MSIEKTEVVNLVEVVENGSVQVRTAVKIVEDGRLISTSLHRHVIAPGDDYSGQDAKVQAICAAAHTADVIAAYKTATAAKGI